MHRTEPEVFLVAETRMSLVGLERYLERVGGTEWLDRADVGSDAEILTEFGGRLCYRAWKPGLNANVTKIREGNETYLANIIKSRHGSVMEHASVSFVFHNVSRVFTHELVRHRTGVAISQESLRYVRLTDIGFLMPPELEFDPKVVDEWNHVIKEIEDLQAWMAQRFALDEPDTNFEFKKKITSAMRRIAPLGLSTGLLWTANMRALRHIIELRTDPSAESEIRMVFDAVATIVTDRYSNLFQDFTRGENGAWVPAASKI